MRERIALNKLAAARVAHNNNTLKLRVELKHRTTLHHLNRIAMASSSYGCPLMGDQTRTSERLRIAKNWSTTV
jgi:hypothetical protein